jgi:hypothetical protein
MAFRRWVVGVVLAGAVFWGTGCGPTVEAEEVETQELQGEKQRQFCGGIAGFPCPEGLTCVDNPRDSCDPKQGGADCGGICVKDKCPAPGPNVEYVSRDTTECLAITFQCKEGFTQFFNECGCGCERKRNTCNRPHRRYISRDPQQCALVRFSCEPGEQHFSDECGCGCERAP